MVVVTTPAKVVVVLRLTAAVFFLAGIYQDFFVTVVGVALNKI